MSIKKWPAGKQIQLPNRTENSGNQNWEMMDTTKKKHE